MSTVTLAEAKAHLSISAGTYDGELQGMLEAAEAAIEARCGPLGPVSRTQRVVGSGGALVLSVTPIVSLTSLTPVGGVASDISALDVDSLAGTIANSSGSYGSGRYDIVYLAGRATLPPDLRMAVLELVRHMWDTQRGPSRRPGSTASDATSNTIPGAAYMFPFRVEQLLGPHMQLAIG